MKTIKAKLNCMTLKKDYLEYKTSVNDQMLKERMPMIELDYSI